MLTVKWRWPLKDPLPVVLFSSGFSALEVFEKIELGGQNAVIVTTR